MTEQQLREAMADLVAGQPPMRGDSRADLRRGRRRLVVHQATTVAGVGAVAAGTVAALSLSGGSERADGPAGSESVLQRCSETKGGLDPALFGAGSKVLTSEEAADGSLGAAVLSSNGDYWASCTLFEGGESSFTEPVLTYPVDAPKLPGKEANSIEVNDDTVMYVDRFPADVARVDMTLTDGRTLSAPAVDGFVVLQRTIEGLGDVSLDTLTLYDADGSVLADESMAPGDGILPLAYTSMTPAMGVNPLVARCTQVDNGPLDPVEYGVGARVLTAETDPSGDVSAVIRSTDRETWAECHLSTDPDDEFNGWTARYPITAPEPGEGRLEQNSYAFGDGDFGYVDRFPADVARVELDFGDGLVLTAETVDGWVVFQREDERFADAAMRAPSITLYGAGGQVLADESMASGDASLPVEYWTLVPLPLAAGGEVEHQPNAPAG